MKRVILTNRQLNEIIKEENTTTVQLNTTGNTIPAVTNTVMSNTPEINNASKYGDVNLHISNQKLNGSNDSVPTQHVEVEKGQNINQAIQQQVNPTVLSDGGDIEVSGDGISEGKSFSKRQIEEARLEKIRKEGSVMTKKQLKEEWEEKPNDDANQWNDEFKMFIQGLRNGEAIEVGDNTIAVEIFKGKTASNDPRYVTFTKGDNRLQDDHFYIQHSQPLKPKYIREIYNCAGWEYDENCEDYEQLNEDEIDWNQRKQMRMDNFWDTLEYYIGLKDEQGGLNPEQLAHAEDVCNKLSCFGADAEEFCDYAREVLGLDKLQENKIEINPKNKNKFNATKKKTGKSTEELTHSKNPLTKKWNKK